MEPVLDEAEQAGTVDCENIGMVGLFQKADADVRMSAYRAEALAELAQMVEIFACAAAVDEAQLQVALQHVFQVIAYLRRRREIDTENRNANLLDGSGEPMDTGSGFINWATMTPVPEPGRWASMLLGMAALGAWRRARSRC